MIIKRTYNKTYWGGLMRKSQEEKLFKEGWKLTSEEITGYRFNWAWGCVALLFFFPLAVICFNKQVIAGYEKK